MTPCTAVDAAADAPLEAAQRNALVESVYPMIKGMANDLFHWMDPDNRADIIQEGVLGAMRAAERYDAQHEPATTFSTFARSWIRFRMLRAAKALVNPRLVLMHENEAWGGACETSARAFATVEAQESFSHIRPLLARLKPIEIAVLIRHIAYGESMRSIGHGHGVSRQYVNQAKNAALRHIRDELTPA